MRAISLIMTCVTVILVAYWYLPFAYWLAPEARRNFFAPRGPDAQAVLTAEQRKEREEERRATIRQQWQQIPTMVDEAREAINAAAHSSKEWNEEIEPLRTSVQGRVIAGQKDLVEQIFYLFEEDRPDPATLDQWRTDITELETTFNSVSDQEEAPPRESLDRLEQLHADALAAKQAWTTAVEQAQAINREASRRLKPAAEESLDELFKLAKDQQLLADLESRRQADAERAEQERQRRALEEARLAEEAATNQQLRKEALSPEVASTLAPLFERRRVELYLTAGPSVAARSTLEAKAISFTWLEQIGALEDSVDGLHLLNKVGTSYHLEGRRWPFRTHPSTWSDDQLAYLQRAQDYLRRLGPTLVKEGLLAP